MFIIILTFSLVIMSMSCVILLSYVLFELRLYKLLFILYICRNLFTLNGFRISTSLFLGLNKKLITFFRIDLVRSGSTKIVIQDIYKLPLYKGQICVKKSVVLLSREVIQNTPIYIKTNIVSCFRFTLSF